MASRNATPSVTGTTPRDSALQRSNRVALYARVSTTEQSTDSQLLDLRRYVRERG